MKKDVGNFLTLHTGTFKFVFQLSSIVATKVYAIYLTIRR